MNGLGALVRAAFVSLWPRNTARYGFAPYADKARDSAYNLLFCDKPDVFRAAKVDERSEQWPTVLAKEPYAAGLRASADDESFDVRGRLLAYNRLRELGQPVTLTDVLGVVVEVMLPDGLDVLATYADQSVYFIHHKGAVDAIDSAPLKWRPTMMRLVTASQMAVNRIGPWRQARVPPPTQGMIRMSFLTADGLYFGQGLLSVMDKDELARPIIAASTELLKFVTQASTS